MPDSYHEQFFIAAGREFHPANIDDWQHVLGEAVRYAHEHGEDQVTLMARDPQTDQITRLDSDGIWREVEDG